MLRCMFEMGNNCQVKAQANPSDASSQNAKLTVAGVVHNRKKNYKPQQQWKNKQVVPVTIKDNRNGPNLTDGDTVIPIASNTKASNEEPWQEVTGKSTTKNTSN